MSRVALIACSARKLDRPAPARELYQGDLFRRAVAYAGATCDCWYVLSAPHHVVDPHQVLEPYELSLQDVVRSGRGCLLHPDPHTAWVTRCRGALMGDRSALGPRVRPGDTVVMLAGQLYAEPLGAWLRAWGVAVDRPLRGMGIGQQRAWLARATVDAPPATPQMELFGGAA
jgi:hypothetical protein